MTNYEKIKNLSKNELAWLLMNDVTSGGKHGCPLCIHKGWKDCKELADDVRLSCIEGHRQWLNREPTEEDAELYAVAKNNDVIDEYNSMSKEEQANWRTVSENGYITGLERVEPPEWYKHIWEE